MSPGVIDPIPTRADDATLVQGLLAGDRTQFASLMRRYNRRLYRLARATLRDATEAEDALQETYLTAFRSLHQYRGDASLATWLSRLLLNECFGRLRRDNRRQRLFNVVRSDDAAEVVADPESHRPEHIAERGEMRALLEQEIDRLPEQFRLVFLLRSIEELSVEETAQTLAIPPATVRSRYFRARALLRESLARAIDSAERDVFDFGGAHCDRVVATVLARLACNPYSTGQNHAPD